MLTLSMTGMIYMVTIACATILLKCIGAQWVSFNRRRVFANPERPLELGSAGRVELPPRLSIARHGSK
jgi:hypothetical protein